jgi:hypothetical protein
MSSQLLDVPHKHPSSIWSFADNTLTLVREAVLTAGYVPLTTLAEKAVVSYELSSVHFGSHVHPHWPPAFYEISLSAVYELLLASALTNSLRAGRISMERKSCRLS